ncbi:MAG: 3-polyprenyl-4-hydroxybenzoate carboxy-lyase UbiX [Candidatus Carbobacillus altaicus]|uniref:Flavin prenyltransferase UbiX n=1 Tax=Candidatus Carbonibacillus altaicus TaxID=2163959 RepID=A0A2R6Y1P9_9BACL|nr:MAG: 3-polyprenyl-4-hydroxybenzoate carboxy-lyase UbiX [Candidatus Carbobacillus altaicus]
MQRFVVAITGASGFMYGVRAVQVLFQAGYEVHVVVSDNAYMVAAKELRLRFHPNRETVWQMLVRQPESHPAEGEVTRGKEGRLILHPFRDVSAPIASGSFETQGGIIIPASMGTVGSFALGLSNNLIERAFDVLLKEGRRIVLVPRETPLSAIHLEHMLRLARLGVRIVPAMPAFYHRPQTVEEMVDFVVGKALDALGVPDIHLFRRWGEEEES